jgi:hypothetical protein
MIGNIGLEGTTLKIRMNSLRSLGRKFSLGRPSSNSGSSLEKARERREVTENELHQGYYKTSFGSHSL